MSTVKKVLTTQISRVMVSCAGFSLSAALVYVGFVIDQSIAISAGLLGFAAGAVLVVMDLKIFVHSANQVLEMAEPVYAARAGISAPVVKAMPAVDDWALNVGFVESSAPSVVVRSMAKIGGIEIRSFDSNDHESELERLERISKSMGATGARKNLLVSAVGTTLVGESSLGDYVEGHLSFHHLVFPEILPGFDLLPADSPKNFRRPATLKEALQLASTDYEQTVLIVRNEDVKLYEALLRSEAQTVRAEATRL